MSEVFIAHLPPAEDGRLKVLPGVSLLVDPDTGEIAKQTYRCGGLPEDCYTPRPAHESCSVPGGIFEGKIICPDCSRLLQETPWGCPP